MAAVSKRRNLSIQKEQRETIKFKASEKIAKKKKTIIPKILVGKGRLDILANVAVPVSWDHTRDQYVKHDYDHFNKMLVRRMGKPTTRLSQQNIDDLEFWILSKTERALNSSTSAPQVDKLNANVFPNYYNSVYVWVLNF